jgi:CheY-like chemotaxis protein
MSVLPKKILIVDDEKSIRGFLTVVGKRQFGLDTAEASNGLKAIELLEREDFDLVLSDFSMPELDGCGLYDWISEHRPGLRDKFILMTAYAGDDRVTRLLRENPSVLLLSKPFSTDELGKALSS